MRHAKSDWGADYQDDHERPLNERGVRSAKIMGRLLSAKGLTPDIVISSTAVRARSTAELARQAGGWDAPLRLERDLYDSGSDGVVAVAAKAPDVASVMLVGHQPTWGRLVEVITGDRVDIKTATTVVIELQIDRWPDLPGNEGRLADMYHPRDHFDTDLDRP